MDWPFHLLILAAVGGVIWWGLARKPDADTRRQIENAVSARGMTLVELKTEWRNAGPNRLIMVYVARVRNPFGNIQKMRFSRDPATYADVDVERLAPKAK